MHVGMCLLGLSRHRFMLACAFWVCLLECVPCGSTCCVDSSNGLLKKWRSMASSWSCVGQCGLAGLIWLGPALFEFIVVYVEPCWGLFSSLLFLFSPVQDCIAHIIDLGLVWLGPALLLCHCRLCSACWRLYGSSHWLGRVFGMGSVHCVSRCFLGSLSYMFVMLPLWFGCCLCWWFACLLLSVLQVVSF